MKTCHVIFLLVFAFACTKANQQENTATNSSSKKETQFFKKDMIVYVTADQGRFHTADCMFSEDASPVKFHEAREMGKRACGNCRPLAKAEKKQCTGTTAEGKQCDRLTANTNGKCYLHSKENSTQH